MLAGCWRGRGIFESIEAIAEGKIIKNKIQEDVHLLDVIHMLLKMNVVTTITETGRLTF